MGVAALLIFVSSRIPLRISSVPLAHTHLDNNNTEKNVKKKKKKKTKKTKKEEEEKKIRKSRRRIQIVGACFQHFLKPTLL